jgi:hypothetical protein
MRPHLLLLGAAPSIAIPEGHQPYPVYAEGSIESVTIQLVCDDGEVAEVTFPRA